MQSISTEKKNIKYKLFLPLLEQHMMLKAQRLQGSRISLHLVSVFSPKQVWMYKVSSIWVWNRIYKTNCVSRSLVDKTIIALVLPVRRRGAGLFLVQVLLLLFPERILPGSEMLWESLWEPPVPEPEWRNKQHWKPRRTQIQSQNPWK